MEQLSLFSKPLGSDKKFYYKNFILNIVRNPRQRMLYLSITKEADIRVSCSRSTSIKQICVFIDENHNWIERQLVRHKKLRRTSSKKHLLSGETFPFCGVDKTLCILHNADKVWITIKGHKIYIHWPQNVESKTIMKALQKFYKYQAENLLAQKIFVYSKKMDLYPSKVSFRVQKSLFGSCSEEGRISLNWTLIVSPHFVMDYVVVHELAHLKYFKHSRKFWSYVKQYHSGYLEAEKWLKNKGHKIDFLQELS